MLDGIDVFGLVFVAVMGPVVLSLLAILLYKGVLEPVFRR